MTKQQSTEDRMTNQHAPSTIGALDELGRRLSIATESRRSGATSPRRGLTIAAVGVAALIATPAIGSISGVFNSHSSIEEALPDAAAVIDPENPVATGRALGKLGIDVRWSFVEDHPSGATPTTARDVDAPPSGTVILSVLAADGSSEVTEETRSLLIEVAPVGSDVAESHR